jgi:DNA-binding transcriptional LysR family regulator
MGPQHARYEVFALVVETGNVSAAAARLGQPRATVSRALSALEADLGVALVARTTRRVTPTPAGQRLYERIRPLLDAWGEVEAETRAEAWDVRGAVRVSAIPLAAAALAPVCAALQREHPHLSVELVANVHLPDLRGDTYDVAIWAGDLRDPDLVSRPLSGGWVGLVASPDYLNRAGVPASIADLEGHALLRGHSGSSRPRVWWPLRDGGRFRVDGRFVTNDHVLLYEAALAGMGIALLSDVSVREALADGRLVRVLPEVGQHAVLRVIVAQRALRPARVRVFVDAVFQHFERHPLGGATVGIGFAPPPTR